MIRIPMTRPQFEIRAAEVQKHLGCPHLEDSGTLSHSGVQAKYSFDGLYLKITVEKHPFFVKEEYVESQITAWFAGTAAA